MSRELKRVQPITPGNALKSPLVHLARERKFQDNSMTNELGYSLAELMIVLVIVGILTMLAIPRFAGIMNRAYAVEAKDQLRYLMMLQEAHFLEHGEYSSDLTQLGYEQQRLIKDGGTARYSIRIETIGTSGYIAVAESTVDFDGDGQMNVWQVQAKGRIQEILPD